MEKAPLAASSRKMARISILPELFVGGDVGRQLAQGDGGAVGATPLPGREPCGPCHCRVTRGAGEAATTATSSAVRARLQIAISSRSPLSWRPFMFQRPK